MKTSGSAENSFARSETGAGVSRRMVVFIGLGVWLLAIPLAHGVVPWVISLFWARHGWEAGQPNLWNLLGLVPVALGIAGLAWVMVTGFASVSQLPDRVKLGLAPILLLTSGPFAWSRNPMYVERTDIVGRVEPFLREHSRCRGVPGLLGAGGLHHCATRGAFT